MNLVGIEKQGQPNDYYLYQGKELQQEIGIYDFHARGYDQVLGRTWQQDPLAEIYFNYSPYSFIANNPIIFTDPTGAYIVIYYEEDGEEKEYKYEYGVAYNGSNSFVKNTIAQLDYLIDNSPVEKNIIKELSNDKDFKWGLSSVSIADLSKDISERSVGDAIVTLGFPGAKEAITTYNDLVGFETNTGGLQSPLSTLYHEGGHAYLRLTYYKLAQKYLETNNPKYLIEMNNLVEKMDSKAEGYLDYEEKYINDQYETPLARQMGEGIRTSDYGNKVYETSGPFTTMPKNGVGPINLPLGRLPTSVIKLFFKK